MHSLARFRRRSGWVLALLPCLVLRALLPAGVMTASAADAAGVVLCSLHHAREPASPAPSHAGAGNAGQCPCLYGIGAAPVAAAPPPLAVVARVTRLDATPTQGPVERQRRLLPAVRAPPAVAA